MAEFSHLEATVEDLKNEVNGMNQSLKKMESNLKELYTALVGNTAFGQEGVVKRIETLEATHEKWKSKINWMYGYIFGIGTVSTLIIEFIKAKFK
jgi:prefoldin subunit 5